MNDANNLLELDVGSDNGDNDDGGEGVDVGVGVVVGDIEDVVSLEGT